MSPELSHDAGCACSGGVDTFGGRSVCPIELEGELTSSKFAVVLDLIGCLLAFFLNTRKFAVTR
jgi:hypothetical protein